MLYFDLQGFLTDVVDPSRATDVPLPDANLGAGLEWNFTGYKWVQVDRNPKEPEQPPKPSRFISVPGFFDRFGTLKWPILTSADASVKALVMDCSVRIKTGINLDTQDVSNGVLLLQSKGFAVDRAAIIDAPIKESERP